MARRKRERADPGQRPPGPWHEARALGPARADALYLEGPGDPFRWGFAMREDGLFVRGCGGRETWRAFGVRGPGGEEKTKAFIEGEALAAEFKAGGYAGLVAGMEDMEVKRIDVCRDARDAPVSLSLYDHLSGGRGADSHDRSDFGNSLTVSAGSRRSPVYLRIYTKAYKGKPPPAYLEALWGGWEDEDVTRVEYEFKHAAVKGLHGGDVDAALIERMWRDGTTRYRMRRGKVKDFSQAQKAGECEGWARLRSAECEKRAREHRADALIGCERHLMRILQRYSRAGADVAAVVARYEKEHTVMDADEAKRAKDLARRVQRMQDLRWLGERDDMVDVHGDIDHGEAKANEQ